MIETMPSLVTSQPTMIETMPPLVKEMPFAVKDDKKLIVAAKGGLLPFLLGSVWFVGIELTRNGMKSRISLEWNEICGICTKIGYKVMLRRRNLALPEYLTERDGPPHASRFKSKDDSGLYKNLLQELAQKKGLHIPKYATTNSGPPHMPSFVSTVEIGGQSFEGKAAKSKKQAETNAAKIAYSGLQEPKESVSSGRASLGPTILPSGCQLTEALKISSSILQSVINDDLQESIAPRHKLIIHKEEDEEYIDGNEQKLSSKLTPANTEFSSHRAPTPPPDADIDTKRPRYLPSSRDSVYSSLRDPFPSDPFTLSSSSPKAARSECSNNLSMGLTDEPPVRAGATNIVPREKNFGLPSHAKHETS
ncbi:hypothetical protein Acr_20g0011200 [Actinidia rufa]|uniref:DRBM domain-containing protein n=1 Tax=Actinidia rufa TaxID=165716 RepID=A0A7J0GF12_9ERIC|nr:hypothetical protein Acr_20g0011200 [Actinidia rufa]